MKQATTIDWQIQTLEARGLKICNKQKLVAFLNSVHYYRFTGYAKLFMSNDQFINNTTDIQLIRIYTFDTELRGLLNEVLDYIEVFTKTKMTNHFSLNHSPTCYKHKRFFNMSQNSFTVFKDKIQKSIDDSYKHNELPTKHYVDKNIDLPLWILIEILTLGTTTMIYQCFSNKITKNNISKELIGLDHHYLDNYLEVLTYIRNICSHRGRLFGRKFFKSPLLTNHDKKILTTAQIIHDNPLFIYIYISTKFLNTLNMREPFIKKINSLFSQYPEIQPFSLGFPTNWKSILRKIK